MLAKQYILHKECREKLFHGIEQMYQAVSATLGPHGRSVLLQRGNHTQESTRDGVTVAEECYMQDIFEDMGAQLVREASQKANVQAGDATTTAIVLARGMCKSGLEAVEKRANVYQLSKGMSLATEAVVQELDKMSKKIASEEEFAKVATIATQDEEIGKIIAKTFMNAGEHGTIDIERSDDPGITSEKTDGLSFDKGWESKRMFAVYLNDPKKKRCIQEDIPVLVVEKRIENQDQLIPIMEKLAGTLDQNQGMEDRANWPEKTCKMIVICDDFSGSALSCMVANNTVMKFPDGIRKPFHLIFVQAPSYGVHKTEIMKDICAITGATFISEEHGLKRIEYATLADLGRAKKIIVEGDRTVIVAEETVQQKKMISDRLDLLKAELKDMSQDDIERKELELRLATLTDGISTLKVGAESEGERHELRRRVEDGVRAVRSAREEGVTPGCGVALLQCIPTVDELIKNCTNDDQIVGMEIVKEALSSVALRLLEVAFVEQFELPQEQRTKILPEDQRKAIVERMQKSGLGYDFKSDQLADMMELGVWDAKKAVRTALQAANSCAANFLRIDACVAEIDDATDLFAKIGDQFRR